MTSVVASVKDFRVEYYSCPVGTPTPRLSWRVETDEPGWRQVAYELEVAEGDQVTVCYVDGEDSILVPWPAAPLRSREQREVRVRVWPAGATSPTEWSEPLLVEAALLEPADWSASMVCPSWHDEPMQSAPVHLLRKEFEAPADMVHARLYVTAQGVYRPYLNGERVGDHVLSPGWTAYHQRLRYQVFDVTSQLRAGANAIAAQVADGWSRGFIAWSGFKAAYGPDLGLLAQLEITRADGSITTIRTDESWRASTGPITMADIYNGEHYDGRLEAGITGWMEPGFDDSSWSSVRTIPRELSTLVVQGSEPVREIEELAPVEITRTADGRHIIDFGQNHVGVLRLSGISLQAGAELELKHAEVLQDGELLTELLRSADCTDRYISNGRFNQTYQPTFTFHGYRYAQVTGWDGELSVDNICSVVLHSDMQRTGRMETSNPLLNQFMSNAAWSMRGNFLDIPTDCPQRDERLGWTGDLQVFAPTASFLHDCLGFLSSWMQDLALEMGPDGAMPVVIPDVLTPAKKWAKENGNPSELDMATTFTAAWGDSAVLVPWTLYQRFGDLSVLERQYDSMSRYTDGCVRSYGRDMSAMGFQFGDWIDPTFPHPYPFGNSDPYLIACGHLSLVAQVMEQTAKLLGKDEDVAHWGEIGGHYRQIFCDYWWVEDEGRLRSDFMTSYAIAICFQLLPSADAVRRAGVRLRELLEERQHRISTGFIGTPLICDALTIAGQLDTAYLLVENTEKPSFLYPITKGATTIWERWDSIDDDGRVQLTDMTSFNHYALGAMADWLHRTVGGLAPLAPGYRTIRVRPRPGGSLTYSRAALDTGYGPCSVTWSLTEGSFWVEVVVPPGAEALLELPIEGWTTSTVGSGSHRFTGTYVVPQIEIAEPTTATVWSGPGL